MTQKDTNGKEMTAIQMRYEGKPSYEIAQATGYGEAHVRRLFMDGGRLEKAYADYSAEQERTLKDITTRVLARVKKTAEEALEEMVALSKNPHPAIRFKANEYLLTLAGVTNETTLKSILGKLSFEEARKRIADVFQQLYGKAIETEININIIGIYKCPKCGEEMVPASDKIFGDKGTNDQ